MREFISLVQKKYSISGGSRWQILGTQKVSPFMGTSHPWSWRFSMVGMWLKSGLSESFPELFQLKEGEEDLFSLFPRLSRIRTHDWWQVRLLPCGKAGLRMSGDRRLVVLSEGQPAPFHLSIGSWANTFPLSTQVGFCLLHPKLFWPIHLLSGIILSLKRFVQLCFLFH